MNKFHSFIQVTVEKPECVCDYNEYMNGVDKLDQNLSYYPVIRKTKKWTKKFTMYLFQIALFNSYVIYKCTLRADGKKPKCLRDYHTSIVEALINSLAQPA